MKNKKDSLKDNKGVTLIEILITIGIVMFLSASMLQIVRFSDTQRGLIMGTEKVKSGIRLAQTYSLSIPQDSTQRHICGFGVQPSGSDLIIYYLYNNDFEDNPNGCFSGFPGAGLSRVDVETVSLEDEFSILGEDIYFRSPYGGVYVEGGGQLSGDETRYITIVRNTDGQSKQVTINGGGKINL